jgi:hypothetical protein
MTARALYEQNTGFGDEVDPDDAPVTFSPWEYAEERCEAIIAALQCDRLARSNSQLAGVCIWVVNGRDLWKTRAQDTERRPKMRRPPH